MLYLYYLKHCVLVLLYEGKDSTELLAIFLLPGFCFGNLSLNMLLELQKLTFTID